MKKFKLNGKEYELSCDGRFLRDYQRLFKSNLISDLYMATQKCDLLITAQLFYVAAKIETPFDEWLSSFENPLFILPLHAELATFFLKATTPTVELKGDEKDVKKKTNQ